MNWFKSQILFNLHDRKFSQNASYYYKWYKFDLEVQSQSTYTVYTFFEMSVTIINSMLNRFKSPSLFFLDLLVKLLWITGTLCYVAQTGSWLNASTQHCDQHISEPHWVIIHSINHNPSWWASVFFSVISTDITWC